MAESKEEREWRKWHNQQKGQTKSEKAEESIEQIYSNWRNKWREAGPIRFATEVLQIDPENGGPLLLSNDQKEFLEDVCNNGVQLAIISAGRGSGKTFILAVYITWRIFTHEFYHISCMGGSGEQSDIIQNYIKGWIRYSEDLRMFTAKNIKRSIKTHASSGASFHSCSATSVRGPHVRDVIIDEEAAGEEEGGTRNIKAALWEVSTAKDLRIIKSSTPQLMWGDFLETWNDYDKLGFKRYQWAIAKHINGEKDPYKVYKDEVSSHWVSNVPWVNNATIQIQRRQKSNDEWLIEALGAVSISSGLVFKPEDIDSCVCDKCKVCRPYENPNPRENFDGCPLAQYYLQLEGMPTRNIPSSSKLAVQYIGDRVMGIDWGDIAPDDYSTIARYGKTVFVLEHKELFGQSNEEKIRTADNLAKKWGIEIIRPDPAQWSYSETLENMGYSIHKLFSFEGGDEKTEYLYVLKKYVERHDIKIPRCFQALIKSLKNLTYDSTGKIRKSNDHAFDSLIYAISLYGEEDESEAWTTKEVEESGAKMWNPNKEDKNVVPEPVAEGENDIKGPSNDEDFNPFDENYLRSRRGNEGFNFWFERKPQEDPKKKFKKEFGDRAE